MQEGSRIYTPVRLGFPRQTLEGASYNGHKIPPGMVRLFSFQSLHPLDSSNPFQLVIMNLMAANRDPIAFDRPDEFLPERWMDGRKGRTDLKGEGGDKLGVTHLTYGAGRRVCPGIDSTFWLPEFVCTTVC
jgi:cytochrome P450